MNNLQRIEKLRTVFEGNDWPLNKKIFENKFNVYCALANLLDDEEFKLILSLTEDFKYFHYDKYSILIEDCFAKLDLRKYNKYDEIYVLSLKTPEDHKKMKSGDSLSYPVAHQYIKDEYHGEKKEIKLIEKANSLIDVRKSRKAGLFIFIDDFVGSGETGYKTINNYKTRIYKDGDAVIVISLVAMETGITVLSPMVDEFVTSIVLKKGVTESNKIPDKEAAFKVIDRIEMRLKDVEDMKYGYRKSEALVSMIRTPDNTFPMFYWKICSNGDSWPGPFDR